MRRISLPLFGILLVGLVVTGELSKSVYLKSSNRQIASVNSFYHSVFSEWTNIPSVCKEDFPLTEFQKTQCDRYWRNFLTSALLATFPILLALTFFLAWKHAVTRTYQRAASKVSRRKVNALGQVVGAAPPDLYSWLHGFRATRVKTGDNEVTAYLENPAEQGASVHLYEAGRWFRRQQLVGVKTGIS
jgi:hypothetical protein